MAPANYANKSCHTIKYTFIINRLQKKYKNFMQSIFMFFYAIMFPLIYQDFIVRLLFAKQKRPSRIKRKGKEGEYVINFPNSTNR